MDFESGHSDGSHIHLTKSQKLATINEGSSLLSPDVEHRSVSSYRGGFSESIRKLRSHTMTVSLLEKPSEDRRASAFMAGWNVSNLIQGTGILGVPYAVRMGGWAGVASILVIAWVCCFTGKLLIDCLYEDSKRSGQRKRVRTNYPEVGDAVLPGIGYKIVSCVQVCEMFGGIVMYIVLLATVFYDMLQAYSELNIYHWAIICTYVAFPGIFIKRVSIIAWISMISVFSLMAGLATLIIFCITEYKDMKITNIPLFNAETFPIGFGIIVFSYCAHAVFPGVEGSMKEPRKFPTMMNLSFLLAASIKCILGLMAVLRFGPETDQVITVNMKSSLAFNYLANAFVITNVFLAFPICFFVVLETWDTNLLQFFPHLQPDSRYHWFWLLITRLLLATLALFLSIVVPHFGLLMGFVGSFTGTCLSFVFPCVFHMKLKWNKLKWYDVLLRCFVIVFGLVCGGFGLVFSARDLAKAFNSQGFK